MYQFAAMQQTRTVTLPPLFWRFQTKEDILRVNKSKITAENNFSEYHFDIEGNYQSSKDKNTLLCLILQICYPCFNPQTAKFVYLRFSSIVWLLQFLSHFLQVLEARSKLTPFHTKFLVNRARFLTSVCTNLLLYCKPVH